MVSLNTNNFSNNEEIEINGSYINDIEIEIPTNINKKNLFPVENIVAIDSNNNLKDSYVKNKNSSLSLGVNIKDAKMTWESFLNASIIPPGYKNGGLHYTGYIADNINEWCLPSWVWTNAALVRMYCNKGETTKATQIGDLLLKQQLECGGWIVRNDYKAEGAIPTLAPNDSAYISNNAFIELYKATNKVVYLDAAKKCADWIIETARPDGLVWSGYDMKSKQWDKDYIIVDTGFTAGLFANLFDITQDEKYKTFLEKFVNQYVKLFFNPSNKGFATSLNKQNKQIGGMFARGQAWALEGLIPAYRVLKKEELKQVISSTISNLLEKQLKNGGWAYNFPKSLLGEDCKGVALIAKSLMEWNLIEQNDQVVISAHKALDWCVKQTASNGECKGGIFSFCMEGAVVHNFYTKTAFVYTSAYAIEVYDMLKEER
jgi:rhamnogalacturonyl hydrolase YesR